MERSLRLERQFKWIIALATLGVVAAVVGMSPRLRDLAAEWGERGWQEAMRRLVGLEPTREQVDELREVRRRQTARNTMASLTRFYDKTSPEMRAMFKAAGMDPEGGLIGVGRATNGFLLSSKVFEPDERGRSYRLRPDTRSVWLRQVTLIDGPFGLFLVPDTPEVRAAAGAAGAIVDEVSRQSTNSWGLRGPEPDPSADVRGIALGDSFMQGMFNGDEDTPPLDLQRALGRRWGRSVSVLNTGHIGYAPEQYYRTLLEYGPRFDPHFVVVSICPNDFGDGDDVLVGRGDDWDEGAYWVGEILQWCRSRQVACLVVAVPVDRQILGIRRDGIYPGRFSDLFSGATFQYLNPFDVFLDEHLRLLREDPEASQNRSRCLLFNGHINDNHLSPRGSKLWAEVVARRLSFIVAPPKASRAGSSGKAKETATAGSAQEGEERRVVEP